MAINANVMAEAENILNSINDEKKKIKVVKKECGLIERSLSDEEKVILVEDNRQLLFG